MLQTTDINLMISFTPRYLVYKYKILKTFTKFYSRYKDLECKFVPRSDKKKGYLKLRGFYGDVITQIKSSNVTHLTR